MSQPLNFGNETETTRTKDFNEEQRKYEENSVEINVLSESFRC